MIEIFKWLVLISATFFTIFGCFAYWRNRQEIANKLFGLLSIAFAVWSYGWFEVLLIKSPVFGKKEPMIKVRKMK